VVSQLVQFNANTNALFLDRTKHRTRTVCRHTKHISDIGVEVIKQQKKTKKYIVEEEEEMPETMYNESPHTGLCCWSRDPIYETGGGRERI